MNFEKTFDSFHDYIVVMANPKTIINDKYAPRNIKERLVKADRIIECLKRLESKREPFRFEKDIKKVADAYIESNKEKPLLKNFIVEDENENIKDDNKETIRAEIKKYRLQKAKSLNYKPYFIFNDQTLEKILSIMPSTLDDLKKISGFGDKKIESYGQDIINIINESSEKII